MDYKYSRILIVFLSLLTMISYSYAQPDFGPLMVRSQAPLQSTGVSTRLRDSSHFDNEERFLSISAASVWAENEDYTLDYYQNDVFAGVQLLFKPTLKAELSYTYSFAGNNHLDSLTMFFHDTIGMSQNGREDTANHRFYIDAPDYFDEPLEGFENETLRSAWELYLEQQLVKGASNTLSIGGTLYYDYVHSGPFKRASFEQAIQLNYAGKIGRNNSAYIMASVTHRSPERLSQIALNEWTVNAGVSYQYRPSFRHAYLLEYRIYEGEAEELSDLSEPSHELTFGYRFHFGSSALELAMVENLINMDNSADIAFTLSFRHLL